MQAKKIYDLIIIGSGPAGLAASIYASRYKLDHLVFGVESGGQMNEIYVLENWPGDISLPGRDLIARMKEHAESFGIKIRNESVSGIRKNADQTFAATTPAGTYLARALILAMGAQYRKMNIPGEKEFTGKGVSYCGTCDAPFFKDKVVAVVGGGNSAAVVALELSDWAKKIYLIHKEKKLLADPVWIDKVETIAKLEKIAGTQIIEIKGENMAERIILDKSHEDKTYLPVDGVFIEVGSEPGVLLAKKLGVETDDGNYIKVKENMSTSVPGVYAAGDITTGSNKFRQVLTAASEGAIAANSAYKILKLK